MARLLATVLLAVGLIVALPSQSSAEPCVSVGLDGVSAECVWSYSEYVQTSSSGDEHTWVVAIQCANGGICADQVECIENGQAGFVHDVYMDGVDVGDVCVPESEVDEVNIAQLIVREFKRIKWPASRLVVQPPDGRTLVNFETNFYTLDKDPVEQLVRIAGQQVTIRAVRTSYTFHFGDGQVFTGPNPGRPHPNLDVTHVYKTVEDVGVSLDVTYAGEYRIGDGPWVAIDDTLTVAGPAQDLTIVEAIPQLVLR